MTAFTLSRRTLLGATIAGAFSVGIRFSEPELIREATAAEPVPFGAWITVHPDNTIEIALHKSEMGQGVSTALPMLVAEELDADWDTITVRDAYGRPEYGTFGMQFTFGSMSVSTSWLPLRTAGAAVRAVLLEAAAARWEVPVDTLRTERSMVLHDATGNAATYGELAADAALLPLPAQPALKDPADFTLIGTNVPRRDSVAKSTGTASYGIDVVVPDMLVAVPLRPAAFGAVPESWDESVALAIPGVVAVKPLPAPGAGMDSGLAVIATGFWAASQGRDALAPTVVWTAGTALADDAAITAQLEALLAEPAPLAFEVGNPEAAIQRTKTRVEATYTTPFLAHVTMEPMSAVAHVRADAVEIWTGTQAQGFIFPLVEQLTGLPRTAIVLHQQYLGTGMGRRVETDVVADAINLSSMMQAPVKVIWPREEDLRHDFYRPATAHAITVGLDPSGRPFTWNHRLAGESNITRYAFFSATGPTGDTIDPMMVSGLTDPFRYPVPHRRIESAVASSGVPVGFWRGVGETNNAFVVESMINELAQAAGIDPLQYRLDLLADDPRSVAVLTLAREESGWDTTPPAGIGRGVAFTDFGGSRVATVIEATIVDTLPRILKATVAVDCGLVVNPVIAQQQISGATITGLSAALLEQVVIAEGGVQQRSLAEYPLLRYDQAPEITVVFVPSAEPPTGLGEPATVTAPPALTAALWAVDGLRRRSLPLR